MVRRRAPKRSARQWRRPYGAKVQEQNLRVAGLSAHRAGGRRRLTGMLGFTAVFEVYPDVTLADVTGQAIEKPTLTVTEAEVEKTLEVLRKQRTSYVETDARLGRRTIGW
jgi:trigger factor